VQVLHLQKDATNGLKAKMFSFSAIFALTSSKAKMLPSAYFLLFLFLLVRNQTQEFFHKSDFFVVVSYFLVAGPSSKNSLSKQINQPEN
jgi:hypothetical protein